MTKLTKNRRLGIAATILMIAATVGIVLWRADTAAAAPAAQPFSITTSGGITFKFTNAPANGLQLVATPFGANPMAGNDSKLITISNTGSAPLKLQGADSTCTFSDLFLVPPGQEVVGVLPSASFSCGLQVASTTLVAGSGTVTVQ
jgi:hypothetical protein